MKKKSIIHLCNRETLDQNTQGLGELVGDEEWAVFLFKNIVRR